jgi:imidazolonepropionase-like amidohydrolase
MVTLQSPAKPNVAGADRWRRALGAAQGFVRLLLERGVRVLPGSDTPCGALVPGRSLWRELSLLTGAGMTPEQALRAATSDAADFLGKADLGRLRPGAVADMVFVRGNPTERIPRRPEIIATVHGGVPHAHADLLAAADAAISQPCDDPWMLQFRAHGRPSS